jgi:hypothetical protein
MTLKRALLFLVALVGGIVMLHTGVTKAEKTSSVANSGLPQLREERTYKIPPNKFTGTTAEFMVGDIPTAVAWSPDGKKIAAFSSYAQNLTAWSVDGDIIKVLHPALNYLDNSLEFFE